MTGADIVAGVIACYIWLFANPILSLVLYFLPIIIAAGRKHKNIAAISIFSLLFGWVFFIWIVFVLWAALGERKSKTTSTPNKDNEIKQTLITQHPENKTKNRAIHIYK